LGVGNDGVTGPFYDVHSSELDRSSTKVIDGNSAVQISLSSVVWPRPLMERREVALMESTENERTVAVIPRTLTPPDRAPIKGFVLPVVVGALSAQMNLLPVSACAATAVPAKIVEPSPSNFQTWTFSPSILTIHVGDTVAWTNTGQANHTVTNTGVFDSDNLAPGAVFSFSFSKPGTYNYQCTYHPWMKGTVDVLAAGQSAAPSPTTTLAPPTPMPPSATAARASVSAVAQPTLVPTTAAVLSTPTAASADVQPTDTALPSPSATTRVTSPAIATIATTTSPAPTSPPSSPSAAQQSTPTTTERAGTVNSAVLGAGIVGLLILAVVGLALSRQRG
jgi:plastocyanin